MKSKDSGYREIIQDEEHLALFLRNMAKFDRFFCDAMASGIDYTLRLEVHGAGGRIAHCRVYNDGFDRPVGAPRPRKERAGKVD